MRRKSILVSGVALLAIIACDSFDAPLEGLGTGMPHIRIVQWPDSVSVGDSAHAHVEITNERGEEIPWLQVAWQIDSTRVARLRGSFSDRERRVIGMSEGTARLRMTTFHQYVESHSFGGQSVIVTVTYLDTTSVLFVRR